MEASSGIFDIDENQAKFDEFFRRYYNEKILEVIRGYPETKSLIVDFHDLDKYDIALADELILNPNETLSAAKNALMSLDFPSDLPKVDINIRFINLPETYKQLISEIRSDQVGKFLSIDGIVRKATDVRPKLVMASFECRRCGNIMGVEQIESTIKEPFLCESCETRGPFKLLPEESIFIDSQKMLIQESLENLEGGEHPKQIKVTLEDDLTGKWIPGDRIEIAGVLRAVRKRFREKASKVFDIFIEANSIQPIELEFEEVKITKKDEKKIIKLSKDPLIYEKIKDSIAPHIYGYSSIKEAVMYQLFTSPRIELPDGGIIRGDSHVLILGEPSTGKSEILHYVARKLAPRGIYTAGRGTSGAGLTATAVKDEFGDGGWSLEAGALVLADKGIACIDEFDKMEATDRSAMHEAMEQQTVSVAKAGILATFRAGCAILAAANPKFGRFDDYRPISDQIDLSPTLLSRFDLIFFVRDKMEETKVIAHHIMDSVVSPNKIRPPIETELLKMYIAYARQNIVPALTDDASERIEQFYVNMRETARDAENVPIPLTTRQLWAVIRLARASARVRLSDEVTAEDAERAINLVMVSLKEAGVDLETGKVDIDKIMVGVTRSQRDKIKVILDIVRELEKEFGTAAKAEILERADEEGISKENAEELIEMLKKRAELYEPRHGHYKIV
ncbi:MAG: minichromosome maintenance protein MCM [Candidatus Hydrothermarchaeales archaeon]